MNKKQITLKKLILPKETVSRMQPFQLRQYFVITNMLHDLDFYGKLLSFISNVPESSPVERSDKAGNQINILIKYISNIYEMVKFLKRDVIERIDKQDMLGTEACKIISEYEKNYVDIYRFIRNKYGFHYEWEEDLEQFICDAVKEYGDLDIYLSDAISGNDVFASSSAIVFMTIMDKMRKHGYPDKSSGKLFDDLATSAIRMGESLKIFYRRYLLDCVLESARFIKTGENVEIPAKKFSECQLSFFVVPG